MGHSASKEKKVAKRKKNTNRNQAQDPHTDKTGFETHGKEETKHKHRFQDIFSKPVELVQGYVAPEFSKNTAQESFIRSCLEENFVFSNLDKSEFNKLLKSFEPTRVPKNTEIITQGTVADFFYILDTGSVEFYVDRKKVGSGSRGTSFGELALLYNCKRNATVKCTEECHLWRVDQLTFRNIIAHTAAETNKETMEILRKVPFVSELSDNYVNTIANAVSIVNFSEGEKLITKGEVGEAFFVIKEGNVAVTDIEAGGITYDDIEIGPGDYLGERAIIAKEPRAANATALGPVTTFRLTKEEFENILGPHKELIRNSNDLKRLKGIPTFAKGSLTQQEYSSILSHKVVLQKVPTGEIVLAAQTTSPGALYMVRSGKIVAMKGDEEAFTVSDGGYFGIETLWSHGENKDAMSPYTFIAKEDAELRVISAQDIAMVVDVKKLHCEIPNAQFIYTDTTSSSDDSDVDSEKKVVVEFKDLEKHRILGVGTFGKVWLVSSNKRSKDKPEAYALKIQEKRQLLSFGQVDGVKREKDVMASLKHPFVIELINYYQDATNIYMVLGLVQGGELYTAMKRDNRHVVPLDETAFYSAAILEGLTYMHNKRIVYRDLKPENVLIDADGYTVIVDLGFAKEIGNDLTYTLCGTPLYLAPEVILGRGHNKGCDIWSLAVLMYEMAYGETPFYEDGIDQIGLFKKICRSRYSLPSSGPNCSIVLNDLITRMLHLDKTRRLGMGAGGANDIKNHPFFAKINFEDLVNKQIAAPWKPNIKDALDVSSFDSWEHEEKVTKSRPLSAKEQVLFKGFGNQL
eukprot:CAMPEP_0184857692 /NCGR_PEP_ID=MMETSP0580-20130426/2842_1 /TAXON_ID=1118495 /ORGANISM="Dactyliosolen fragilissimus" /LENGTH=801 /DNA_ID=CAMNT_0027353433 /DNA_START=163 /DNA_END=2568 /DNA_ORIENTATION=+